MPDTHLLHQLIDAAARRAPDVVALIEPSGRAAYGALAAAVQGFSFGLRGLGLPRTARIGIYLEKRIETVVASFGATAAGGVFVPMNPLLKPEQVAYIARDCDVRILVTSP